MRTIQVEALSGCLVSCTYSPVPLWTADGAAFVASSLTYQLNSGVALSIFYPGCDYEWGLFDDFPLG